MVTIDQLTAMKNTDVFLALSKNRKSAGVKKESLCSPYQGFFVNPFVVDEKEINYCSLLLIVIGPNLFRNAYAS